MEALYTRQTREVERSALRDRGKPPIEQNSPN